MTERKTTTASTKSFDDCKIARPGHEPMKPFAVTNQRTTIPPLLGERAGVRAISLQPRHEALTFLFVQCFALLLLVFAMFFAAPRALAQQLPIAGGASDFNSVEYYGAPHQQDIERLFSGAEAQPLPGGLLLVKKVKIEKFDLSGKLQLIVEAPECVYDPVNIVANSPGEVHVRTGDGEMKIDGEGFLWRQKESTFTISNRVQTVIDRTFKR